MASFTVCVLCYGPHTSLAVRCLESLRAAIQQGAGWVQDIRIGLNDVAPETRAYVQEWACGLSAYGCNVYVFDPGRNVYKYPLMRRMFHDRSQTPELGDMVMWFDDDSYLEPVSAAWWKQLAILCDTHAMVGQRWRMPVQRNQLAWCASQPWWNPRIGPPVPVLHAGRTQQCFEFCQGAWWVLRSDVIRRLNWPIPELRHNGGDSLLGEVLRHCELPVARFDRGVRINADDKGAHSRAKRRGYRDPHHVGADYAGQPLSTSHQQFDCRVLHFPRAN